MAKRRRTMPSEPGGLGGVTRVWESKIVGHDRIPPDQITANPLNFRTHPQAQRDALRDAIEEVGFIRSVTINRRTGNLIDGHERVWQALTSEQPLIDVEYVDLSEEEERLALATMDPISEMAKVDSEILGDLLNQVQTGSEALGNLLTALATDNGILDGLLGGVVEDEVPETPVEPITQPGDLWLLGPHRLLCGDATKPEAMERLMSGQRADLWLTDPPYNVAYVGKTRDALTIDNDSMGDQQFRNFLGEAFIAAFDAMKPGASFYIWHADLEGYNFRGAVHDCDQKVRQCLIWKKNTLVMGRQDYHWKHEPCLYGWKDGASHGWYSDRTQTTVLEFERPTSSQDHPTMKPVALFAYLIANSTAPQGLVLDNFCGSGTSIVACEQLGRTCYALEMAPAYCDVIVKRWETMTGRQAERQPQEA